MRSRERLGIFWYHILLFCMSEWVPSRNCKRAAEGSTWPIVEHCQISESQERIVAEKGICKKWRYTSLEAKTNLVACTWLHARGLISCISGVGYRPNLGIEWNRQQQRHISCCWFTWRRSRCSAHHHGRKREYHKQHGGSFLKPPNWRTKDQRTTANARTTARRMSTRRAATTNFEHDRTCWSRPFFRRIPSTTRPHGANYCNHFFNLNDNLNDKRQRQQQQQR